jgi:hypothetical protein
VAQQLISKKDDVPAAIIRGGNWARSSQFTWTKVSSA